MFPGTIRRLNRPPRARARGGITWYELVGALAGGLLLGYLAVLQYFSIEANIAAISCRAVRKSVTTSVQQFRTDRSGESPGLLHKRVRIGELIKGNFLSFYPECWNKGVYKLNDRDVVYCTYHNPELGD